MPQLAFNPDPVVGILPHNFCELIEGAINILKGKKVTLYPDFLTGGKIDISDYNDGKRGGKVRVRAFIEELDSKTLVIKDIPYGTTTTSVIESIIKAMHKDLHLDPDLLILAKQQWQEKQTLIDKEKKLKEQKV